MPSAIVTGATGILGRAIVSALAQSPEQWDVVYAISRSQTEDYPANVKHKKIDLTASAQDIANQLGDIQVDYLFFAAYIQKDTERENWDTNGALLQNFLDALGLSGADRKLKRVLLTTGAKHYGVHLGQSKNPMEEDDPWIDGPGRPPNFYYNQQRILEQTAREKSWDWVVTYPNDVIGMAQGNFMNLSTSLGIYATVSKELGGELIFPGSEVFYTKFDSFTSSKLHAQFSIWAITEPLASNQAFNAVNGDVESWQNLWPKLARRFGCKIPENQFNLPTPDGSLKKLAERPPIADTAHQRGLSGRVGQGVVEQRIDLVKWSQKEAVKNAWQKLAERNGLEKEALEKATWIFLGFVLGRNYDIVQNMSKARKLGWTGYIDSWDAFEETFDELEKSKVLTGRS